MVAIPVGARPSDSVERLLDIRKLVASLSKETYGRGQTSLDPKSFVQERAKHSTLSALLAKAKPYHIDPADYAAFHHAADRHTTERIAKMGWSLERKDMSQEEIDLYRTRLAIGSKHAPFPDQLPFPEMVLLFGTGLGLSPDECALKLGKQDAKNAAAGGQLEGYLVTDGGKAWSLVSATGRTPEQGLFAANPIRDGHEWIRTMDFDPWILGGMLRWISDHRNFTIEMRTPRPTRRRFEREATNARLPGGVPPVYYTLTVSDTIKTDRIESMFHAPPQRSISYRHDVAGHERIRVRRGAMPLTPKDEVGLLERKYRVYKPGQPLSEEDAARLRRREKLFRRENEWLALLVTRVASFVSPSDPSLPYVPAVRKLKKPPEPGHRLKENHG